MTTRVGLLGYGYWGVNLARNVAASRTCSLVAIADPLPERQAAAAGRHPETRIVADIDALLEMPEVDAVIVATPASRHAEAAAAALESGRHVLVEKPLAMTTDDADRVIAAAERASRTLMVGHTFLFSDPVRVLRERIGDGELGAVQYLYSQRLSLGRIRRDCNALWNFAPHDVAIMLHLLDERVVEVSATGHAFIQPDIDDVFFANLTFKSGVTANLHVSWIDPRKTRLMTIVGDRKMAIYNDVSVDQKLWIVDAGVARGDGGFGAYESLGDFQWRTRAGDIVIPQIPMIEPLLVEIEAFGSACESGQPPLADGVHGREVVRVLEAIERSAHGRGTPVEIEP